MRKEELGTREEVKKTTDSECQMANGKCQITDGKWQVIDSRCQMAEGPGQMAEGECRMEDSQRVTEDRTDTGTDADGHPGTNEDLEPRLPESQIENSKSKISLCRKTGEKAPERSQFLFDANLWQSCG